MTGRELESQSILEISAIEKLKTVSDQADRLKFVVEFVGEQSEIIAGKDAPTPEAEQKSLERLRFMIDIAVNPPVDKEWYAVVNAYEQQIMDRS